MKDSKEMMQQNSDNEVLEKIKGDDKKSLKSFIIIMIVSMIIGGGCGFGMAVAEDMSLTEAIAVFAVKILETIAPYANVALVIVAGIVVAVLYRQSRKLYESWDEEDDEVMNKIETKLGYGLMISSCVLILGYMFFAIGFGKMEATGDLQLVEGICFFFGFIVLMVFTLFSQKKIINFEREMNPEKQGSVFDMKFQKKWADSCDEAEMLQTYKAAYAAYKTTNMTCMIAWMLCVFGMMTWDFGYVPVVMVSSIWLISTLSYSIEAVKLSKNPINK